VVDKARKLKVAAANLGLLHEATWANVRHTLEVIREASPILRDLEKSGKFKMHSAVYEIENGKVVFEGL
jgi:carbonic anhydrase